jgi:hypothetical protein
VLVTCLLANAPGNSTLTLAMILSHIPSANGRDSAKSGANLAAGATVVEVKARDRSLLVSIISVLHASARRGVLVTGPVRSDRGRVVRVPRGRVSDQACVGSDTDQMVGIPGAQGRLGFDRCANLERFA